MAASDGRRGEVRSAPLDTEARLVPLSDIDRRLTADVDDWEILLALHHHAEPWDGLISTDTRMLNLPKELSTLMLTNLTLVVCEVAGHDPVRATGLLLTYLSTVCQQTTRSAAQVWSLGGGRNREPAHPWDYFARVADKRNMSPGELRAEEWLTHKEFVTDPLGG